MEKLKVYLSDWYGLDIIWYGYELIESRLQIENVKKMNGMWTHRVFKMNWSHTF